MSGAVKKGGVLCLLAPPTPPQVRFPNKRHSLRETYARIVVRGEWELEDDATVVREFNRTRFCVEVRVCQRTEAKGGGDSRPPNPGGRRGGQGAGAASWGAAVLCRFSPLPTAHTTPFI